MIFVDISGVHFVWFQSLFPLEIKTQNVKLELIKENSRFFLLLFFRVVFENCSPDSLWRLAQGLSLNKIFIGGTQDTDFNKEKLEDCLRNSDRLFVISGYSGKASGTVFRPF